MPLEINKTKVHLDFHIYAIPDFDLLIGSPSEVLFQVKPSQECLNGEFGKTASATPIPCPEIPMVKHHPNLDPLEEVKFISPLVSPRLYSETECPSPTSLEPKKCPSSHSNVVLHDLSLKNKNSYAMDILLSTMCLYEDHNHLPILVFKLFRRMTVDAYVYHKYCKSRSFNVVLTLQLDR